MDEPRKLTIAFVTGEKNPTVTGLVYAAPRERVGATLILAHGAGAGQRSAFMTEFAEEVSAGGIDLVTFNFLYTEQGRKAPDRAPVLEACYRAVVEHVLADNVRSVRRQPDGGLQDRRVFIGGKSMGGRIATQIAAGDRDLPISGIVLLGYPLHPPGKPQERRDRHLPDVRRPMLFVQGSRDSFGTPDELTGILGSLEPPPTLHIVEGGDHSYRIAGTSKKQAEVMAGIRQAVADWIRKIVTTQAG